MTAESSRWVDAWFPVDYSNRAPLTIQVGKKADLLLLRADPLKTMTAYDLIDTVFLNGNPIPRGSLLPTN